MGGGEGQLAVFLIEYSVISVMDVTVSVLG